MANRVIEIQSLTDPAVWFHCPGKDNPADLTTRGLYAQELVKSDMWLRGPFWLSQPVDCFPKLGHSQLPDTLSEEAVTGDVVSLHTASQEGLLMLFNKWGSLTKTWRILAWVCRFVKNCGRPTVVERESDLTQNELLEARLKLYRLTQLHYFPAEYAALQEGRPLLKNSPLCKLTPFIGNNGLLRVKGRLQNSNLSYESKHPIILPRGHLSSILVHFQHKLLKHAGVDTMVSSLRNVYLIIGLRRLAKQVKRECVYCQFQDAKGCNAPAAPLPDLRVSQAPPFAVTGVDFAGPLFCSDVPKKKYYVLLFTCAVVRAIHLEVTDSLSTADFLLALRRFCSRRGMPSIIYSDNVGTFKAAESQLVKLFGPNTPQWKYIMPKSPWWGGWWERLIRSVKSALRKTLGKLTVNKTELETTLIEIEACVNSRPLTFLGDEVDSMQPLTPSHFLIGRSAGFQPEITEDERVLSRMDLTHWERLRVDLLDKFWNKWSKEYLTNLPLTVEKFKSRGDISVGSVVLIQEDKVPRMQWLMGVVKDLIKGRDGVVRSAIIKTSKGIRFRAVQRLHDLEVGPGGVEQFKV